MKTLIMIFLIFPIITFSQKINSKLLVKNNWSIDKYIRDAETVFAQDTLI